MIVEGSSHQQSVAKEILYEEWGARRAPCLNGGKGMHGKAAAEKANGRSLMAPHQQILVEAQVA